MEGGARRCQGARVGLVLLQGAGLAAQRTANALTGPLLCASEGRLRTDPTRRAHGHKVAQAIHRGRTAKQTARASLGSRQHTG